MPEPRAHKRGSLKHHADLTKAIGERLRMFRREARYSQEAVSSQTGINRSGLSDVENGLRPVDAVELLQLARVYGTTVDDLLDTSMTGPTAHPQAAVTTRLLLAAERLELLELRLRALTQTDGEPARADRGSSARRRPDPHT